MEEARASNAAVPIETKRRLRALPYRFQGGPAAREQAAECLATAALYEAGDDRRGQQAVIQVILNRVRSPLFPDTVEAVIFQPWQFEPILNGWFWREPSPASWRAARDAARGEDPTGGALYFWNPAKSGHQPHLEARPSAGWIGNHRFAY